MLELDSWMRVIKNDQIGKVSNKLWNLMSFIYALIIWLILGLFPLFPVDITVTNYKLTPKTVYLNPKTRVSFFDIIKHDFRLSWETTDPNTGYTYLTEVNPIWLLLFVFSLLLIYMLVTALRYKHIENKK